MADSTNKEEDVVQTATTAEKKKYTILIIEDDSVLKNMYSQRLEIEGYQVFGALDGEEGLAIFKKEKIDIIVTDIMLPRMSGIEFLEKLTKTKKGKQVPVIAWSNLADEEAKEKALALGAKEFLQKGGMGLDELTEIVKKYLT